MTEKCPHLGVPLFNDDFREDLITYGRQDRIEKKQMRFVR
jgi:hypothetical protein